MGQGPVYQELYALSKASFERQYEDRATRTFSTESAGVEQAKEKLLATQGFQAYIPRRDQLRWVLELTDDDFAEGETETDGKHKLLFFETNWGAVQSVMAGDILTMPCPRADEVYMMPKGNLSGYADSDSTTATNASSEQ